MGRFTCKSCGAALLVPNPSNIPCNRDHIIRCNVCLEYHMFTYQQISNEFYKRVYGIHLDSSVKEEKKVAELNNGYYVFSLTRREAPKVCHKFHSEAIEEAKRLARQNPGQRFEVLSIVAACQMPAPGVNVEFTPDGEEITRPPF